MSHCIKKHIPTSMFFEHANPCLTRTVSKPVICEDCVFKRVAAAPPPPPQPPALLLCLKRCKLRTCEQKHAGILFQTHHACIVFATAPAPDPPPLQTPPPQTPCLTMRKTSMSFLFQVTQISMSMSSQFPLYLLKVNLYPSVCA